MIRHAYMYRTTLPWLAMASFGQLQHDVPAHTWQHLNVLISKANVVQRIRDRSLCFWIYSTSYLTELTSPHCPARHSWDSSILKPASPWAAPWCQSINMSCCLRITWKSSSTSSSDADINFLLTPHNIDPRIAKVTPL